MKSCDWSLRGFFHVLPVCGPNVVLLGPVWQCDHLAEEEGADCVPFLWCVVCILSVRVCLLFLLVFIAKTRLFKYTENFTTKKIKIFR